MPRAQLHLATPERLFGKRRTSFRTSMQSQRTLGFCAQEKYQRCTPGIDNSQAKSSLASRRSAMPLGSARVNLNCHELLSHRLCAGVVRCADMTLHDAKVFICSAKVTSFNITEATLTAVA